MRTIPAAGNSSLSPSRDRSAVRPCRPSPGTSARCSHRACSTACWSRRARPRHVVRGTARKVKAKTEESVNVNEDTGVATEKTVITEFITISVRTVDAEGIIRTLEQKIALAPIEE